MTVLPIVDRELRVAARRQGTYRNRLWAAAGATALAVWRSLQLAWEGASPSTQGQHLFYTLSTLAFLYCLCIGARVTSDCVSEEKREGTLGLLFLTDLKGWDVVLGKLVASSLNSFYGLMAVLPLIAMPLLLGGVPGIQFAKMVLVLLNALFFSLSAGILVSTLSRNDRRAMFATVVLVFGSALLPYGIVFFLGSVMEWFQTPADIADVLPSLLANPIYPFLTLMPLSGLPIPPLPPSGFWISLGLVHAASWLLLLTSACLLPTIWRDRAKTQPEPRLTWADRWQSWSLGDAQVRRARRRRFLPENPYLWLVSRDRLKPGYAWLYLISMILIWAWGYYQHQDVMFDFYPLAPTLILVHGVLKLWAATEVSYRLVEDQRNGALELLLSTPLRFDEMLAGQRKALDRQFGKPLLVLCAIELVVFQSTYPMLVILSVLVMLAADLFTLMHLGMHLSLKARNINEVVMKSALLVLVLPWVLCILLWPFWSSTWHHFSGHRSAPGLQHGVLFWLAVGLLNNAVVMACVLRRTTLTRWRAKAASGGPPAVDVLRRAAAILGEPGGRLSGGN